MSIVIVQECLADHLHVQVHAVVMTRRTLRIVCSSGVELVDIQSRMPSCLHHRTGKRSEVLMTSSTRQIVDRLIGRHCTQGQNRDVGGSGWPRRCRRHGECVVRRRCVSLSHYSFVASHAISRRARYLGRRGLGHRVMGEAATKVVEVTGDRGLMAVGTIPVIDSGRSRRSRIDGYVIERTALIRALQIGKGRPGRSGSLGQPLHI